MHDFHERLPGYDERNIWHDGCGECETRAAIPLLGLTHLDHGLEAKLAEMFGR
ncbi:MAG TPA: hypothetical protein VK631_05010 [Solirubrobacteraceae bacterium]|nr:hypothetical protein [Solirubrobacteraceae bacterium]